MYSGYSGVRYRQKITYGAWLHQPMSFRAEYTRNFGCEQWLNPFRLLKLGRLRTNIDMDVKARKYYVDLVKKLNNELNKSS